MTLSLLALIALFFLCLAIILVVLVTIVAAALIWLQRSADRWTRRSQIRAQDYGLYHYPRRK